MTCVSGIEQSIRPNRSQHIAEQVQKHECSRDAGRMAPGVSHWIEAA